MSTESTNSDQERYSHGYGTHTKVLAERTAHTHASFFLPHIKPGMSLLDCGCGPGTITASFAEILNPGEVVGIDIEITRAKTFAEESGITNVKFQEANIYELPFPDELFDAAFAHTLLQHLQDPLAALNEIRRVLKPGGVIGVREEDMGSRITHPHYPLLEQLFELQWRFWQHSNGSPFLARRHRELLQGAGFSNIIVSTSTTCHASLEATRNFAEPRSRLILEPHFADKVIELGWANRELLEDMSAAFKEWGNDPNAVFALLQFEAVGWKE